MDEFLEGLLDGAEALVVEVAVPDAGVHQVANGVLGTADVEVDGKPVLEELVVRELLVVVRVDVAEEVPARACGAGHGRGLADALHAVAVVLLPFGRVLERRLSALALVVLEFGEDERELVVGEREDLAVVGVDHRHGLAPVALTRKDPFAEVVVHGALRDAHLLEFGGDGLLRLFDCEAGELLGVDQLATLAEVVLLFESVL